MNNLNPSRKPAAVRRAVHLRSQKSFRWLIGFASRFRTVEYMKHLNHIIFGFVITLAGLSAQAQVNYAVSGNTAYVTNSPDAAGDIVIASNYNGFPVTSIGYGAFFYDYSLTSVTIPNSVTNIGGEAFDGSGITNMTIPDSVTSIGESAFGGCENLTNVTIGNGVTSIGEFAFAGCDSLTSITIPGNVSSIGIHVFDSCTVLTNVIIGNNVTTIGDSMFYNCGALESVTIGNSVTNIGQAAFAYCASLTNVMIGDSVTSIGQAAFYACYSLASVTLPDSVTNIARSYFSSCYSLTNITVAVNNPAYSSVNGVLFDKLKATLIEFPAGLRGAYVIPDTVTNIGDYAFAGEFDANDYGLTGVTIPDSVVSIGNHAFFQTSLTTVTIPDSVTVIGELAFSGCFNLTSVTIGNGVTNIVDDTFSGCTSLTNVTIPSSVTSIGNDAFYSCTSLTNVTIPNSVTNIGDGAFWACTSMLSFAVAADNPVYSSVNGVLFDKLKTTLIEFPGGLGPDYTVPNGVTSIAASAFHLCNGLTSVTIPGSVTNIGDDAFYYCLNLTNITFLGNPPALGSEVFQFLPLTVEQYAQVFYYYGTSGWSSSYGGVPTVELFPPPQIGSNTGGVHSGKFGFTLTGVSGQPITIESSTNLVDWQPVWTNTLSGTSTNFTDSQWTNHPQRFYRVSSP